MHVELMSVLTQNSSKEYNKTICLYWSLVILRRSHVMTQFLIFVSFLLTEKTQRPRTAHLPPPPPPPPLIITDARITSTRSPTSGIEPP